MAGRRVWKDCRVPSTSQGTNGCRERLQGGRAECKVWNKWVHGAAAGRRCRTQDVAQVGARGGQTGRFSITRFGTDACKNGSTHVCSACSGDIPCRGAYVCSARSGDFPCWGGRTCAVHARATSHAGGPYVCSAHMGVASAVEVGCHDSYEASRTNASMCMHAWALRPWKWRVSCHH
eukprot:365956-Chlamydomonas_euryale.AAC.7